LLVVVIVVVVAIAVVVFVVAVLENEKKTSSRAKEVKNRYLHGTAFRSKHATDFIPRYWYVEPQKSKFYFLKTGRSTSTVHIR
jgi:NADH:ubiquinone oxidoreductase subunit 3 (subunit A)